ncbi:hypothetical protein TNCV_736001 [Trichonephila clavipes]|uniref:Uncharacterized protein n=1 Tax=Trichonephila clavipes TaxID=2585209 RepID=A0A8X6SRZ5_TRICX|nr:hypothetical protein TNCV_736001 [Trichonephila clavipes]
MDFFLLSYKELDVWGLPISSVEDFIPRVSVAAERICDLPGIFWNVKSSMHRHYSACHTSSGQPHASTLPRVTFNQAQVRTEEGSPVQLPCVAQGNPPPTYRYVNLKAF